MMTEISIEVEKMSEIFTKFKIHGLPCPVVIHEFTEPDFSYPHCHPWGFTSFVIKGYTERVYTIHPNKTVTFEDITRENNTCHRIEASHIHQIISFIEDKSYTIIVPDQGYSVKSGVYNFDNGVKFRYWDEENFREI